MKTTIRISTAVFILCCLMACEALFGAYDNSVDPKSDDYQGYESIPAAGVTLNAKTASTFVRNTVQLVATLNPANAANRDLTWKSNNPEVATVSDSGLVTGMKPGSCTITVSTDNGHSAECALTIGWLPVESISLPANISVRRNRSRQITPLISPENASDITVSWGCSDESIASISGTGILQGLNYGTATITACTVDGSKSVQSTVHVVNGGIVSFYANGGQGSMSDQVISEGATAFLSPIAFTRPGYAFFGWASSAGGAVIYNDSAAYTMGSDDLSLYAQWGTTSSSIGVDFFGSLIPGDSFSTCRFKEQRDLYLRTVIDHAGPYYLTWADMGMENTDLDIVVSLLGSDGKTIIGSVNQIDSASGIPILVALSPGEYYLKLSTKNGIIDTGSVDIKLFQTQEVAASLCQRVLVGAEYSTVSFAGHQSKLLALDITERKDYVLQWSDLGDGDGKDTVDVKLSLYDEARNEIVSGLTDIDAGYGEPRRLALEAGRYWIALNTASGFSESGSCKVRMYPTDTGSIDLGMFARLNVGSDFQTVQFTREIDKSLAMDVAESGSYLLQWADSGEGDGQQTVDVNLSLYDETRSRVISNISAVNNGYVSPRSVSLEAGRYWVVLATTSGSARSGSCKLRVYPADTETIDLDFYTRINIGTEYQEIQFNKVKGILLALDIPESGSYLLQWADSGEGDGQQTVDVNLSLYDETRSRIVSNISAVNNGYSSPRSTNLGAGRYWIALDTAAGSTKTGTCKLRVYPADAETIDLDLYARINLSMEYQVIQFKKEKAKLLGLDIAESGIYLLQWADSGEGDGQQTVDVNLSLYNEDRSRIVSNISAVNDGYASPRSAVLEAGRYWIALNTSSGSAKTGSCNLRVYRVDTSSLEVNFLNRLIVAPEYSELRFTKEKKKVLVVAVHDPGDYSLRWSDAGSGDGTGTVDILVSVLGKDKSTVLSSCDSRDMGYADPVELHDLAAGVYHILLRTKSATAESGSVKIMMYRN